MNTADEKCRFCGQPLTEITTDDDLKRGMRGFECHGPKGSDRYYRPIYPTALDLMMDDMDNLRRGRKHEGFAIKLQEPHDDRESS